MMSLGEALLIAASLPCPCLLPSNDPLRGSIAMVDLSTQILDDTRQIIEAAQETAYRLADLTLVRRNWLLGRRIAQEELRGADRADYGTYIINGL